MFHLLNIKILNLVILRSLLRLVKLLFQWQEILNQIHFIEIRYLALASERLILQFNVLSLKLFVNTSRVPEFLIPANSHPGKVF